LPIPDLCSKSNRLQLEPIIGEGPDMEGVPIDP
jgi:hypothetical protein